MAVIYRATNTVNGKYYIGYAVDFEKRKNEHLYKAKRNERQYFHNAIRKYGEDSFTWEILKEDATLEDEIFFIEKYQSFYTYEKGYNLTKGGEGKLGFIPHEETREKLRKSHTGKKPTEKQLQVLRSNAQKMKETGHTEDTKRKISDAHKGKVFSEEHKKNISLNHASKKETVNFYKSEEYKHKMSASLKGKKRTAESIERYKLAAQKREQMRREKKQKEIQGF